MTRAPTFRLALPFAFACALTACGGGASGTDASTNGTEQSTLDTSLRSRIDTLGLTGDPMTGRQTPSPDDALATLGMRLFFSKSLGGEFDSACASCHHPNLGGGDGLSLPVGVGATNPDLLGPGRVDGDAVPNVPRNAPTIFNLAIWDSVLFHDGRVQAIDPVASAEGGAAGIRTPDTAFGVADNNAGATLSAAQARFPVTSVEEMRADLLPGASNAELRDRLAARIGGFGDGSGELSRNDWLPLFQTAFGVADSAENLITFDRIVEAIAAYERSQVLTNSPWSRYVGGDLSAISDNAKRGAELFYTPPNAGGAGCVACHAGDRFTDERFHTNAFPMIGPGKGDGINTTDDFGRERETDNARDRYAFRTPTLLNVELTAPYGRSGAYASLEDVIAHYDNQGNAVARFFDNGGWCQLEQFSSLDAGTCAALYPDAEAHSTEALDKLRTDRQAGRSRLPNINLNAQDRADLADFLRSLTADCATDPNCTSQWIPPRDGGPDDQQLDAVDRDLNPL